MREDFYDVDDSAEKLQKDFLAIVDAPENRLQTYQKAAEELQHREESGIALAAYLQAHPLPKSLLFGEAQDYWTAQVADSIKAAAALAAPVEFSLISDRILTIRGEAVRPHSSTIGYSRFYRAAWAFLATVSMIWGGVVGASLAGASLVGPVTAASGVIGLLGLSATLFVAGRRTNHEHA